MAQPVPRPDATTRREFAGMISHIDEALEQITQEMATAGLWDNLGQPSYGTLGKNQLVPAAGAAGWQCGAHRPG